MLGLSRIRCERELAKILLFFGFLVENLNKRTVFRLDRDFANDMSVIKHVETKFMQYSVVCEFLRDQRDY